MKQNTRTEGAKKENKIKSIVFNLSNSVKKNQIVAVFYDNDYFLLFEADDASFYYIYAALACIFLAFKRIVYICFDDDSVLLSDVV